MVAVPKRSGKSLNEALNRPRSNSIFKKPRLCIDAFVLSHGLFGQFDQGMSPMWLPFKRVVLFCAAVGALTLT
ncbi:Hypothetical protein SynWH7803_1014 [Synechococcus sp. WH 7803]|nr:Hypothetical protein SynWH7803_1014 [Synechococcus sp. WH 7803]